MIDECLDKFSKAKKRAQLQTWIQRLGQMKHLKYKAAEQLAKRGILRADEDKILGLFKRRIYPEIDPRPERELIGRLREAIFGSVAENVVKKSPVPVLVVNPHKVK